MMKQQLPFISMRLLVILFIMVLDLGIWLAHATVAQAHPLTGQMVQSAPRLVALAATQQPSETLQVHMGTATGELKFEPAQLSFQVGKRYKLVLDNPSPEKHYFTAKDFADAIWSQKVEAGNVEVKGAIHELELKPGAIAEWVFVPQKPGTYELHCSIPGHAEAGMIGEIVIS